jgi:5-hydroxyisourate hydrolase
MSGKLSTHVLNIAEGKPAAGMRLALWRVEAGAPVRIVETTTNVDGRTDAPLLTGETFRPGLYEIVFEVGAYFDLPEEEAFLGAVLVRFRITDAERSYHVPLLVSPWAYSTYRGS